MPAHCSVAVIGAGASGLVAARELLREGHCVTVFEQADRIGGTWVYTEETEEEGGEGSGEGPRRRVHSSIYAHLRVNLPREVMGFADFPLDAAFPGSHDPRQFPSHTEVLAYLEAFAARYRLLRHIRFATEVVRLEPVPAAPDASASNGGSGGAWPCRWRVLTRPAASQAGPAADRSNGSTAAADIEQLLATQEQVFDAVVVCNGHFSEPRLPCFPGQAAFPGRQLHSHNYRRPEPFRGQTGEAFLPFLPRLPACLLVTPPCPLLPRDAVVLVGAAFSGADISQELAEVGARVYLCSRDVERLQPAEEAAEQAGGQDGAGGSIIRAPNVQELHADGSVTLVGGHRIERVDAVIYCTGYVYSFPFLKGISATVSVDNNRVHPLHLHVFPPALAPCLSFLGLPWMSVPFLQFELQARWVARCLSGAATLPSRREMEAETAAFYSALDGAGVPKRFTHRQTHDEQWRYNGLLCAACGEPPPPAWRGQLYAAVWAARQLHGRRYRDLALPGEEAAAALVAARVEMTEARRRLEREGQQQGGVGYHA